MISFSSVVAARVTTELPGRYKGCCCTSDLSPIVLSTARAFCLHRFMRRLSLRGLNAGSEIGVDVLLYSLQVTGRLVVTYACGGLCKIALCTNKRVAEV